MIINPSFPKKISWSRIDPQQQVYSWRLNDPGSCADDLLCNVCWTTRAEARQHFWYEQGRAKPVKGTLDGWLKKYVEEIGVAGMNPFEGLLLQEFFAKYAEVRGEDFDTQ